ncbi:hypothetical protein EVG20_g7799 [Dentipellis fragilis]|uniref:F-box domain-containing protein n=1 Tax=Dentipellis fragilis TaxID=205917 RepID=A0A4Y9YBZ3_9AGAM|nr:hypothetical protein EVG20_g7799 [Dentipellis fragilis]
MLLDTERTGLAVSAVEYWDKAERDRFASQRGSITIKTRDIPDARKEIELEMEAVKLVMSSLRTRYNALAFVNRLPSEVLAHIFQCVREAHMLEYTSYNARALIVLKKAIQWVDLTHVCRQWRIVAIDHPGLWSHILIGTKFTEEFLRRSCRGLITIDYTIDSNFTSPQPDEDLEALAGIVSRNLSRIQSFGLSGMPEEFSSIFPVLLGPAPVLEKAALTNQLWRQGTIPAPSLPSNLFNQFAPRLRHLNLYGWNFSWPFLKFNTLVNLHLSREFEGVAEAGDFGEVLAALSRMPLLEGLHLKRVLPPLPLSAPGRSNYIPDGVVALPSLREFVLTDTIRRCHLALDHIATPPDHRIPNILFREPPPTTLKSPLLAIATGFRGASGFGLLLGGGRGPSRREIEDLLDVLPLEHMQVLRISYETTSALLDWPGILCGCTKLQHISVACEPNYDGEPSGIDQLLAVDLSPTGGETASPPFPSLVSLTLRGIDFGHDDEMHDNFLNWLGRWGPFKKLVLQDSILNIALADRLRALAFELMSVMKNKFEKEMGLDS